MPKKALSSTPEMSELVAATLRRFYARHAPSGAVERIAARHAALWEAVLAGQTAGADHVSLSDQAASLGCPRDRVTAADREVVWTLTPEIAAVLACAPGDDRICLHEVREALARLLRSALHGANADYALAA
mgnify:CR=1 FL=1